MRLHVWHPWIILCSQSQLHITRIALQTLELLLNISSSSGNDLFIFIHQKHTQFLLFIHFQISVLRLYKWLPLYTSALSEYGSHHIDTSVHREVEVLKKIYCALYISAPSSSPCMLLKHKNTCTCISQASQDQFMFGPTFLEFSYKPLLSHHYTVYLYTAVTMGHLLRSATPPPRLTAILMFPLESAYGNGCHATWNRNVHTIQKW